MSDIPKSLRRQVIERAGSCCEYCLMPVEGQVAWFPVDHIVPRSHGGRTELENLCLACPRCNGHKWAHELSTDPATGEEASLFSPRTQHWSEHFRWSKINQFEIEGTTSFGRATVVRLQMNDPEMVEIRRLLSELGIQFGPRR